MPCFARCCRKSVSQTPWNRSRRIAPSNWTLMSLSSRSRPPAHSILAAVRYLKRSGIRRNQSRNKSGTSRGITASNSAVSAW